MVGPHGQAPRASAHPLHVEVLGQPAEKPFSSCQHEKSTTKQRNMSTGNPIARTKPNRDLQQKAGQTQAQEELPRGPLAPRTSHSTAARDQPNTCQCGIVFVLGASLDPGRLFFWCLQLLTQGQGSSSTITARISSTGQSSRHRAQ